MRRDTLKYLSIAFLCVNLTLIVTALLFNRSTGEQGVQIALGAIVVAAFVTV
jgi:hypothetical protein